MCYIKRSKEELIKDARIKAEYYYSGGKYLCSEAILASVNEVLNFNMPNEYVRIASGYPVGMGGAGCSCGALTGALGAIGLAYGRKKPGASNKKAMKISNEMHNKFKEKFKSTCCRVLIKDYEFGSKEHIKRCTYVTGEVCEMVTDLILENKSILSKVL